MIRQVVPGMRPRPPQFFQSIRLNHSVRDLREKAKVPPLEREPSPYKTTVGKTARFLQWTLIPVTFAYMALYADFGEREHVFSDVRRWVQKQKEEFWKLSPQERQIAQHEGDLAPGASSP